MFRTCGPLAMLAALISGQFPSLRAEGQDFLYWTQSQRNVTPNVAAVDRAPTIGGARENLLTQLIPPTSAFNGVALDAINRHMFVTDGSGIHRTNLDGSGKITISNIRSTDLEIDAVHGRLFYVPISGTTADVRAMNLDGTGDMFIMTAPGVVQGLAIDVAANKLYASTDNPSAPIREAALDGSGQIAFRNLVGSVGAFDVEVDPVGGELFWTNNNSGNGVFSARLDGTGNVTTVLPGAGVGVNGLHFDTVDRKLYAFSVFSGALGIVRCNPDGSSLDEFIPNAPNGQYLETIHLIPEPASALLSAIAFFCCASTRVHRASFARRQFAGWLRCEAGSR